MHFTTEKGYSVASKIDALLSECLQVHELENSENAGGYAALIRTVASSLQIMNEAAKLQIPQITSRGRGV